MFKLVSSVIFFLFLFSSLLSGQNINSIFIKDIQIENQFYIGNINKIILKYKHKHRTLKEIKLITEELKNEYKRLGYTLVEVKLPKQTITGGVLHLKVNIAKVGNINVDGENYYSKEFIKDSFIQKKGDLLNYKEMVKSLLLLNDYSDLKVNSFLKKSSLKDSTDISIHVEDKKPLHVNTWYDNLGSEDTSKNRLGMDFFYGNLFRDGDEVKLNPVLSFSPSKTKFLSTNYSLPINNLQTKVNFGFLYADYLAGGDFTQLDSDGNTHIYTLGASHPLIRSITNRVDLSMNYYQKYAKNYLLNKISSDENIGLLDIGLLWQKYGVYSTSSLHVSLAKGSLSDGSIESRVDEDIDFLKTNVQFVFNKSVREKLNLVYILNGQYSKDRLPPTEMFSIGGLTTVRGFKSGYKLGDSGFFTSLEGLYKFKFNKKNSFQLGLFCDYGRVYVNEPISGEDKQSFLLGAGVESILNIDDKYLGRLSLGYPISASDDNYDKDLNLYLTINAKLW
jgi:hemolysin activation/secretion protein